MESLFEFMEQSRSLTPLPPRRPLSVRRQGLNGYSASMVTTFAEALAKFADEPALPKAVLNIGQWDHDELLAFHSGEDGFFVRRYFPDIPLDLNWLPSDRDDSTP